MERSDVVMDGVRTRDLRVVSTQLVKGRGPHLQLLVGAGEPA